MAASAASTAAKRAAAGAAAASSASATGSSTLSRSAYLSKIRRAFLLRAHPDRFRSHPDPVRRSQAEVVQAIGCWTSSSEVLDYTSSSPHGGGGRGGQSWKDRFESIAGSQQTSSYRYHLERGDGSLYRGQLDLTDTVPNVLESMSDALRKLGVQLPKAPPSPQTTTAMEVDDDGFLYSSPFGYTTDKNGSSRRRRSRRTGMAPKPGSTRDMVENMYRFVNSTAANSTGGKQTPNGGGEEDIDVEDVVDHRYDKQSLHGRDLLHYLRHTHDAAEQQLRRQYRLDASASALVTRRTYQFQSVDATKLNWSSKSVSVLFQRLTGLHEEHCPRGENTSRYFRVSSFYPLKLELSSDEYSEELCLYDGRLMINPSATPLQWLQTISLVTPASLFRVRDNKDRLKQATRTVQETLGVRVKKGYSCPTKEYHHCLYRLAGTIEGEQQKLLADDDSSSSGLVLSNWSLSSSDKVQLIVEGTYTYRRARVTREGNIQIGSSMPCHRILHSISHLSEEAKRKSYEEEVKLTRLKELVGRACTVLNLEKVGKVPLASVSTDQYLDSLARLLARATGADYETNGGGDEEGGAEDIRKYLAGQSLQIGGSGYFCHLSDDGSIVIPWDFR